MNNQSADFDKEAQKFLERDFNQCFAQMRHYDNISFNLLKFMFTAYTAVIGISIGLYQFSKKESVDLSPAVVALLGIGCVIGLVMFCLVVRLRVYYVAVARYINEHRKFFLDRQPLGFANVVRMHTSLKHPQYFNYRSSDTFYIFVVALLNAILLAGLILAISQIRWAVCGGVVAFALQFGSAVRYLVTREGKSADQTVFGDSAEKR